MKLQRYEETSLRIREVFDKMKKEQPERFKRRIDMSYCCQTFGLEPATDSIARLAECGYKYVELPGQYGGTDVGHQVHLDEIMEALERYDMKVSGVCTFFQKGFAFNDTNYFNRQKAVEYLKNTAEFARATGGQYVLITAAACNEPPFDNGDWERAVMTLHDCAHYFTDCGIKGTIEAIKPGAVCIVNSFAEAARFIDEVNDPGLQYIYGDLDHILNTEDHVGQAILDVGERMLCLHLRDTNGGLPLGHGMMDVDTVIRALYLIGFNTPGHFVSAEPATRGRMFGPVPEELKMMRCRDSIEYFREREEEVLNG